VTTVPFPVSYRLRNREHETTLLYLLPTLSKWTVAVLLKPCSIFIHLESTSLSNTLV